MSLRAIGRTRGERLQERWSEDSLLRGRVHLRQPVAGYRVAIDPVFLAAAAPLAPGQSLLELGCGSGAALVCALHRVPGTWGVGLEIDPVMAACAQGNLTRNGLAARGSVACADILCTPLLGGSSDGSFEVVIANPPFLEAQEISPPQNGEVRRSHVEGTAGLSDWVAAACRAVRPKGWIVFIHRADRLDRLLAAMAAAKVGSLRLFPLWSRAGQGAKRILLAGRPGTQGPMAVLPGMTLHEADGRFTAAARRILEDGCGLNLVE